MLDFTFLPPFLVGLATSGTEPLVESKTAVGRVIVRCTVRDQGVGIPPEHQPNLFKPYMQINAGKLQKSNGTGLGLAVSKMVMELHSGEVRCESAEGRGAAFSFRLPMAVHLLGS